MTQKLLCFTNDAESLATHGQTSMDNTSMDHSFPNGGLLQLQGNLGCPFTMELPICVRPQQFSCM